MQKSIIKITINQKIREKVNEKMFLEANRKKKLEEGDENNHKEEE